MQCSFSDCWRWVALIAPTMILLWSYWEVRERFKYKPTLYDQERVRSLEHFYATLSAKILSMTSSEGSNLRLTGS